MNSNINKTVVTWANSGRIWLYWKQQKTWSKGQRSCCQLHAITLRYSSHCVFSHKPKLSCLKWHTNMSFIVTLGSSIRNSQILAHGTSFYIPWAHTSMSLNAFNRLHTHNELQGQGLYPNTFSLPKPRIAPGIQSTLNQCSGLRNSVGSFQDEPSQLPWNVSSFHWKSPVFIKRPSAFSWLSLKLLVWPSMTRTNSGKYEGIRNFCSMFYDV